RYFGVRLLPIATARQAPIRAATTIAVLRSHSTSASWNTLKPAVLRAGFGRAPGLDRAMGWSYASMKPRFHSNCRTRRLSGYLSGHVERKTNATGKINHT